MPMYQFSCRECGEGFEKKLPMSRSDEQPDCPACGSNWTRKRIGMIAVANGARSQSVAAQPASSPFS